MQISVLHYHFRPGGVRRVIELGLPEIVRTMGVTRVILASGEAPGPAWRERMEAALFPCVSEWITEPALGYWSEQQASAADTRAAIGGVLDRIAPRGGILWAHNLSVGRNMLLAREISGAAAYGTVWLHHHDWWWDGRWERWPEMAGQGVATFEEAVRVTLPCGDRFRHFCVNAADTRLLREWTGIDVRFLPNPVALERAAQPEVDQAREFLRHLTGAAKWWVYPCRGLRRKNIAEALLVQRWLAPEGVTVTTGGASSSAEQSYFSSLTTAAANNGWALYAGTCSDPAAPPVNALLAASDAVTVTSLREGFGLAWHEAAAAGRPLFARIPPGMDETLDATGFTFRHGWRELRVPHDSYDREAEQARVAAGRQRLQTLLPPAFHALTEGDDTFQREFTDFGCLTLAAQLEILDQPDRVLRQALMSQHPELDTPPAPQPIASRAWSPETWAEALVSQGLEPPENSVLENWPRVAVRLLTPRLESWLRCPLLWSAG